MVYEVRHEDMADVLELAVEGLDVRGWHQHAYGSDVGKQCASGHIRTAVFGSVHPTPLTTHRQLVLERAVYHFLGVFLGMPVSTWNDWRGRTEGEVRDALLLGAKRLRETNDEYVP